jgi:Tfp pilus assembly protein FimV
MSSISITGPAIAAPRPQTRLRLTVRGRRVLLSLAALPLAVGIGIAALSGGTALASGQASTAVDYDTVTVMPGDTLWSIAAEVAPEADPRDVIGEIESLNAIRGGSLMAGQELSIPLAYAN